MKHCRLACSAWLLLLTLTLAVPVRAQGKPRPAAPRTAANSETLSLRVMDVAEDHAFIEPGAAKGLRTGDTVTFGTGQFKVVATSSSSAAIALAGQSLPVGTRGSANVLSNRPERVVLALVKPAPLSSFRRPSASEPPAARQTPEPVPLAGPKRSRNRAFLRDGVYAVLPLDGGPRLVANELRGRLHYEPYVERPLAFDLDLSLQTFAGDDFPLRPGAAARAPLRVRELTLSYGTARDFRALVGRLRQASGLSGPLDGARLEAPLFAELRLSAFAGTAPHTLNGMVSSAVGRFGGELVYESTRQNLAARVRVGGHASRFEGALDERKAYASFDLLPRWGRFGGQTELSFFPADNPWHASTTELSGAGFDAEFALDVFHFGGRFDMRKPERSRWLASLLPEEWLCWREPSAPAAACLPADASYSWLVNSGARIGKFSVDLGGQSRFTRGTDATNFGAFASLRWLDVVGRLHLDAGMSTFTGSVLRSTALTLSPGLTFWEGNGDVSLRYRPALVRHRADLRYGVEHSIGGAIWLSPSGTVDLDLGGDWIHGSDIDAWVLNAALAFRLGF